MLNGDRGDSASSIFDRRSDAVAQWLKRDLRAQMIVGDSLVIIWRNDAAALALGRGEDLGETAGVLKAADPQEHAQIASFIKSCGPERTSIAFRREDAADALILTSQRLGEDFAAYCGVSFFRLAALPSPTHADPRQAYGLTRSEATIASSFTSGQDAQEISETFGVSIETVRSHVKNIYMKLRINSREAMIERMARLRI